MPELNPTQWLFEVLTAIGSAFAGWFFGRQKQRAEATQTELDNVHKAIEIWRKTAEDLKAEVEALKNTLKALQTEVSNLHTENNNLKRELDRLKV